MSVKHKSCHFASSMLHILLEYSKQKLSPLNKLSLVKEITITHNNSTFSDSVANYKLSLNNLLEEQGKTAFPRTRGLIHETFLRRNFFLTAIFFLFFYLKKVKNILYSQTFFLRIFLSFFLRLFLRQNLRKIQILENNLLKNHLK